MATRVIGPREWSLQIDDDAYRTYKVVYRVVSDTALNGPAIILGTPGLPRVGDRWAIDNDLDVWVWCRFATNVKACSEIPPGEPVYQWDVEFDFSNRPRNRCQDFTTGNPLSEPEFVSGGFTRYTEEAFYDRFGQAVVNSSHEQMRGPQVEFDRNRPQIKISQNVLLLNLGLLALFVDGVNDRPLWGMPPRTVKLSNVSWERRYWGLCSKYYNRTLEFDVRRDGWDKNLLDEGTKVLNGRWNLSTGRWVLVNIAGQAPDPSNPAHFIRAVDLQGNPTRVLLDGAGKPYNPDPPTVDTCDRCPQGAAETWRISGFGDVGEDFGVYTGEEMNSTGGCDWQTLLPASPFQLPDLTLTYDPFDDVWKLTSPANLGGKYLHGTYETTNDVWLCKGPNTMYRFDPDGTATPTGAFNSDGDWEPSPIVLSAVGGGEPGIIRLEKYPSVNLLLLGIPTDF